METNPTPAKDESGMSEQINAEDILLDYLCLMKNEGVPFTQEQKDEIRQDAMHVLILQVCESYYQKKSHSILASQSSQLDELRKELKDNENEIAALRQAMRSNGLNPYALPINISTRKYVPAKLESDKLIEDARVWMQHKPNCLLIGSKSDITQCTCGLTDFLTRTDKNEKI